MIFKIKSESNGIHVIDRIYSAPEENRTFVYNGKIIFNTGEWQSFGAILLLGAKQTNGRIKVVLEGDKQVLRQIDE